MNTPGNALSAATHAGFLALLPRVQRSARIAFRDVPCAVRREEAVQEAVALAWKWYTRLAQQGKCPSRFPGVFSALVARAVRSGRRLCGQEKARDVLSPVAQRRHGFRVEGLSCPTRRPAEELYSRVSGQRHLDAFEDRLRDNGVTPPPEAAAFRIDFPRFLAGLGERDRSLALFLALGHSCTAAAAEFGVSPGRVTQIRQRLCQGWHAMHGERPPGSAASAC